MRKGKVMALAPLPNNVPKLTIKETTQTVRIVDCPQCKEEIDVTDYRASSMVTCAVCGNTTMIPFYRPRWWYSIKRLWLALFVAISSGLIVGLLVPIIQKEFFK